jgi:hypothetical protein
VTSYGPLLGSNILANGHEHYLNFIRLSFLGGGRRRHHPIAEMNVRVAVVLRGDLLSIEYRDGDENQRVEITPGEVEWEEPDQGRCAGGL